MVVGLSAYSPPHYLARGVMEREYHSMMLGKFAPLVDVNESAVDGPGGAADFTDFQARLSQCIHPRIRSPTLDILYATRFTNVAVPWTAATASDLRCL
jgi:hypothetical protein